MNFEDVIFKELETENIEDVSLAEGAFNINPFLAYYTLKRNTMKKLRNIQDKTVGEAERKAKKLKASVLQGKEKIKAELEMEGGKDESGTVYKLTRQQEEVLSEVYEKYGNDLVKEIMSFRKNVLAPYQVIKRTVKKNKMLTSTETLGMTKEQFKSAIESGRRKIEARGSRFDKFGDLDKKIEKNDRAIKALEDVKKGIASNKRIPPTILERILKEYDLGKGEFDSYSMNDLKKAYYEVMENVEKIGEIGADDESSELEKAKEINRLVQRNIDLRKGRVAKEAVRKRMEVKKAEKGYTDLDRDDLDESYLYEYKVDLTKNKNFRMSNGGFNSALGLYFLRRQIMDQLKPEKKNSIYRQTYSTIVDSLIDEAKGRKRTSAAQMIKNKSNVEFNERERKVWELRPSVKTQSGEITDYVQKLKESDFSNPKFFKKSDKLIEAERAVEAGIKRFERNLKKKITPEEYAKLKKYRLINRLVTVGEMSSPDKLFKSPEEISKEVKAVKRDFLPDAEFERKIREIATIEYDSIEDLENAKKEAKDLFDLKREQGDDDIADKMKGILKKIKDRKSIKTVKLVGGDVEMSDTDLIDAGLIEKTIKQMLKKDYKGDPDALKRDSIRIDNMVKKYKEEGGASAERNIEEIDFLFKQLRSKTNQLMKAED